MASAAIPTAFNGECVICLLPGVRATLPVALNVSDWHRRSRTILLPSLLSIAEPSSPPSRSGETRSAPSFRLWPCLRRLRLCGHAVQFSRAGLGRVDIIEQQPSKLGWCHPLFGEELPVEIRHVVVPDLITDACNRGLLVAHQY